ncbi:MAG: ATP-grasp domain-containing protein [Haloarculaceae archaeon]
MSDPTVLVTGCGAPGFPGTLYSLRADPDRDPRVVGVDVRAEQAGRYLADDFFEVPRADADGFVGELLDVCRRADVDVVLPQVTRELPVLAAERERFADAGIDVAVADADVIGVANDKEALVEVCADVEVPRPETRAAETAAELTDACEALGHPDRPVVVKPPTSNGSRGMRILDPDRDRERAFYEDKPTGVYSTLPELRRILGESFPRLLVMEYLPGTEYTVDAFRPRGGGETVAVPRRREEVRSGISFRTSVERHEAILAATERLADELELTGAFGFQFKLDADGEPKILECNPRVQGTMVTATMAGANLVAAAVRDARGDPLPALEPDWSTTFSRYWGGVGTVDGDVVGDLGNP